MFWDFGEELKLHENSSWKDEPCHVNCDCGRFLEIGNSVFMEYIKTEKGFEFLPQKNVDFGGGLERISAAANNNPDIYMIDSFEPIRKAIEQLSGKSYGEKQEETVSFRIIMDHLRAATFLICDGVAPSNKDQGYFVRRLIRRAVRFAHKLGITENFTQKVSNIVIENYKDLCPKLEEKKDFILSELDKEENKFRKTLEHGLKEFEKAIANLASKNEKKIPGEIAFRLYDTFGFPIELTEELAIEKGLEVDKENFLERFKAHQELSRQGSEQKFKGGLADQSEQTAKLHTATHLMLAALRKVLGPDVWQRGSNITAERLRFDFSYPQKMTPEQIKTVEDMVNDAIKADAEIKCEEMSVSEAKAGGAIGVFDEKYQEKVKVYTMGNFSKEICGGPHAARTGNLKSFKIQKEEASSSGVRRIKAIIGE
jgi:alanyl-tRNA synthetase